MEAQVFRNILPNLTVPVLSSRFELLRPDDQRRALQEYTDQDKVCQIFNEVGGAVRRESATEPENPLNLQQKGYWKLPVKFIFFLVKSLISRPQSMLGAVRPSCRIHRLNSKVVIFYRFQPVSTVNIT